MTTAVLEAPKTLTAADLPAEWAIIPGYDPFRDADGYHFDMKLAKRAVDFFPACLKFIEGDTAGQPFELQPWQKSIVAHAFGWVNDTGLRRYRRVWVYTPRKNGKTPFAAGVTLFMLCADGEPGAQIYSIAADREQAALIYRHAKGFVIAEPEFVNQGVRVFNSTKSITFERNNGVYKALSSDADTKHGFNSHGVMVDEVHAHPNAELIRTLETSTGSRSQPMIWYFTTADYIRESVCNETLKYAKGVRDGLINDPTFMPVIYDVSPDADWKSPKTWASCNPNLGVSIRADYLAAECKRAQAIPAYENTFKRLHLNMQTQQDVRWMAIDVWDKSAAAPLPFAKRQCWAGIDLSTTTDITAFVAVCPDGAGFWDVSAKFWIPGDRIEERERRDRVPYAVWVRDGLVEATPGNVVDYDAVEAFVVKFANDFNLVDAGMDPYNAQALETKLIGHGINMFKFRQGPISMSPPMKELERLLLQGKLRHGGNPVLRWMFGNVAVDMDPKGNICPNKAKATGRIDGIVSLIMALGRANVSPIAPRSVYENKGLMVLEF